MNQLCDILKTNPYPGRGIAIGKSPCGSYGVIVYFIMGRSENSRNRVFVTDGDGIKTKAHKESKLTDPSLIIYSPVRVKDAVHIVTNGDQTDTIYDAIDDGFCGFQKALRTREFEPDGPNYTPRISGILVPGGGYRLSIIKSADGGPESCIRQFFEYDSPLDGQGHFISTYKTDGDPLPSFEGEPISIDIPQDFDSFGHEIWDSLDPDNRVSLFARKVSVKDGVILQTRVVNKLRGG